MALEKYLSTQASVLIAGALIAAGLYFGLRDRTPAPSPGPAATSIVSSRSAPQGPAQTQPLPQSHPIPQMPQASESARNAVRDAALKELEQFRPAVVKTCVKPALEKKPEPKSIKLAFNISFDAQGGQVMRGIVEDRETAREGVAQCVMQEIPILKLPIQPGVPVGVEIPWVLP